MRIFKYKMDDNEVRIKLPVGAQFRSVQCQFNEICLWMEVPDAPTAETERAFVAIGTGHRFNEQGLKYLGTVQQMDGRLIWHVYEKGNPNGKPE